MLQELQANSESVQDLLNINNMKNVINTSNGDFMSNNGNEYFSGTRILGGLSDKLKSMQTPIVATNLKRGSGLSYDPALMGLTHLTTRDEILDKIEDLKVERDILLRKEMERKRNPIPGALDGSGRFTSSKTERQIKALEGQLQKLTNGNNIGTQSRYFSIDKNTPGKIARIPIRKIIPDPVVSTPIESEPIKDNVVSALTTVQKSNGVLDSEKPGNQVSIVVPDFSTAPISTQLQSSLQQGAAQEEVNGKEKDNSSIYIALIVGVLVLFFAFNMGK